MLSQNRKAAGDSDLRLMMREAEERGQHAYPPKARYKRLNLSWT
jgi:hypothetical protein